MSKTIIMSHGDKGGCGKSLTTNIIASYLVKIGHPFMLIDADASQSTSRGDIADRFDKNGDIVAVTSIALTGSEGENSERVNRMFEAIEDDDNDMVVINLPASASDTLEYEGDIVAEYIAEVGYELYIPYNFAPNESSAETAAANAGQPMMQAATRTALVRNLHFATENRYNEIIESNRVLNAMPRLTLPVMARTLKDVLDENAAMNIFDLASRTGPNGSSAINRSRANNYLDRASAAIFAGLDLPIPHRLNNGGGGDDE